jgi:hypothetical protein
MRITTPSGDSKYLHLARVPYLKQNLNLSNSNKINCFGPEMLNRPDFQQIRVS